MHKHLRTISMLALSSALLTQPALALDTKHKQDLTALSTIGVATAAAGPIGFLVGALGGGWLAQQVADADQLDDASAQLATLKETLSQTQTELATQSHALDAARAQQQQYARMALDQLQLELLFRTADSQLTEAGQNRLALLATFLANNPDLSVLIEGFADPRGAEAANLALSKARAEQVAKALTETGVARERLSVVAHGETLSAVQAGDVDGYALERRVSIQLLRTGTNDAFAGVFVR